MHAQPADIDFAVQQAATLEAVCGDIRVDRLHDGETAENGVAVMPFVVNRIHAVSMVRPEFVGKKLVLRTGRIIGMALHMPGVLALHFLQEQDVGIQFAQPFAQLVQHHAAIELRETFMDIVGGDLESGHGMAFYPINVRTCAHPQRPAAFQALPIPLVGNLICLAKSSMRRIGNTARGMMAGST